MKKYQEWLTEEGLLQLESWATDKTVDVKASELFALGKVRGRYNEIHDRLIKEAEDECIVTARTLNDMTPFKGVFCLGKI